MHRVFIAINLPEEIKQELVLHQEKIEKMFTPYRSRACGFGPIRWTKKESLHVTLLFLGSLSDEEIFEVCKIVKETALKNKSFSMNLNKICYGPPKKPPRMVWVQGEKSPELDLIQNDLEKSLTEKIHFVPENRDFSTHITLGRIRVWEFRRIDPEDRPQVEEEISLGFEVSSIEVMESQLRRTGAEYTILESAPLG